MKRLEITVRGTVQGVFFRDHTQRQAKRLDLSGQVRNNPDGSVTIAAEGPEPKLKELLAWAQDGPDAAQVESIDDQWGDATGEYRDFLVRL